jgi:hypothetical protein
MNEKVSIKLELPLQAVDFILVMLSKQPFEQVADLIQGIREQAIPQVPVPEVKPEAESVGLND